MTAYTIPKGGNGITEISGNSIFPRARPTSKAAREAVRKPNLSKGRLRECFKILEDRSLLAFTKAGRYNVYTLISDIDVQSRLGNVTNPESVTFVTTDLQKEAENFLSSIVLDVPQKATGVIPQDWFDHDGRGRENNSRHISVIALPRPGLPWGDTPDTYDTLPTDISRISDVLELKIDVFRGSCQRDHSRHPQFRYSFVANSASNNSPYMPRLGRPGMRSMDRSFFGIPASGWGM